MSKRKGVSLEDKRKRMLELFYEKKDVFQLKVGTIIKDNLKFMVLAKTWFLWFQELEKLGPSEKGVIAQSVKDVVQGLVDDGYVDSEKIGTSVYFWALPRYFYGYDSGKMECFLIITCNFFSKATQTRKRKISELEEKLEGLRAQKETITKEAKKAKVG